MKHITILFSAFFLVQAANAQDAVYADQASSDKKIVRLKTYDLDKIELDKVAAIKMLSVQWDTARLGFVQTGMSNRRQEAVPEYSFDRYLQQFVDQQYGSKLSSSGLHLLFAVKDVRINERTAQMSEKGFCRLKADAYISRDGQQYAFVQAFDTVTIRNGMDVTSRHDENIARAVNHLLRTTLERGIPVLDAQPANMETSDAIKAAQFAALTIPILTDTAYVEGVYASFEEFKANKPSITAFKVVKEKRSTKLIIDDPSQTPIKDPWGFCIKGELYRTSGDAIVPIEKSGHGFVVSNYLQAARRRNQAMFWGSVAGGVVGGAIAASAGKPYLVTTIPYITRQQPEATALDMETGELTL